VRKWSWVDGAKSRDRSVVSVECLLGLNTNSDFHLNVEENVY